MSARTAARAHRVGHLLRQGGLAVLLTMLGAGPCWAASECDGTPSFELSAPVTLSAAEEAALRSLAPLRVSAARAPPLSIYDEKRRIYTSVGVDVFCFIAGQLGLRSQFTLGLEEPIAEKIRQVQTGQADLLIPLSPLPEREERGLFTAPFYDAYYVAIARQRRPLKIEQTGDLAQYRVGIIGNVAIDTVLQDFVPPDQLRRYDDTAKTRALYQALRDNEIDVAVHNQQFFAEERYLYDLFDLTAVHTLREHPRRYGFYVTRSPQHQHLVNVFNRYLAVMDIEPSTARHEVGERELIERYVSQRHQHTLLSAAMAITCVLAVAAFLALRHYRRLTRQLTALNLQIRQQQGALLKANQELERLSQTDPLTGLANRRHFDQTLARELARSQRSGAPLSLILFDADHFKQVNDHYGHSTGDDYLRALARVLTKTAARPADVVARYGGEEFVCLLPDTTAPDARAVAERLRKAAIALGLPSPGTASAPFTISVGVVTLGEVPCTAEELLAEADAQLYAAKNAGRNRVFATTLGAPAGK